jgi:hypothetical protein
METVLAEYHDLSAAEHAVRSLEQRGISIQNVSIVDEVHRIWRRSRPVWARPSLAQSARRAFLIGAVVGFVVTQLALGVQRFAAEEPVSAPLFWVITLAVCSLSGSASALLTMNLSMKRAKPRRKAPRFSVILRADAATLAAVAKLFPRVRRPKGYFRRWSSRAGH